jgi:hypothetical protein
MEHMHPHSCFDKYGSSEFSPAIRVVTVIMTNDKPTGTSVRYIRHNIRTKTLIIDEIKSVILPVKQPT